MVSWTALTCLAHLCACSTRVLRMLCACFAHARHMFCACSAHVLRMLCACFARALRMLCACLAHPLSHALKGRNSARVWTPQLSHTLFYTAFVPFVLVTWRSSENYDAAWYFIHIYKSPSILRIIREQRNSKTRRFRSNAICLHE